MSTETIFYFAIGVFFLMVVGIVLTGLEYRKLNRQAASTDNRVARDN